MIEVRPATADDDLVLADLFTQYGDEYVESLGPQDLRGEGREARSYYREGGLIVAEDSGEILGCVGFEPWGDGVFGRRCRMKRMYVVPKARGRGAGRKLGVAVLVAAKMCGFDEMCLDTTEPMQAATGLYKSLGFEEYAPDYEAPCRDVFYMRLAL